MNTYTYHEHLSHPGFGWIEPLMDQDDPLIFCDVAKRLVEELNTLHEAAYPEKPV